MQTCVIMLKDVCFNYFWMTKKKIHPTKLCNRILWFVSPRRTAKNHQKYHAFCWDCWSVCWVKGFPCIFYFFLHCFCFQWPFNLHQYNATSGRKAWVATPNESKRPPSRPLPFLAILPKQTVIPSLSAKSFSRNFTSAPYKHKHTRNLRGHWNWRWKPHVES